MSKRVLIVDDEKMIREPLELFLNEEGYKAEGASDALEALTKLKENDYGVVITDIKMPGMDGIELMQKAAEIAPDTFFIIMTAYASVNTAIDALRMGAYDYLIKPVEFDDVILRLKRLFDYKKLAKENRALRQQVGAHAGFRDIIGQSESMQRVFDIITRVATTNSNVLITGKSGTGKELVARAIHYNSLRKDEMFLPVNCGAISENLIESELFGHKKGSFTGAMEDKLGLFKVADGGTLFLDEIGDLPLNMQVKLLRVLEDRQFLPVGATKHISTDVRIIAATNQHLFEKIRTGEFREDLYYRLNVVEIKLPTLNERREDIPLLVNHFIQKFRSEMGRRIIGVDNETMKILMGHDWRGGVRELENIIERAIIFARGEVIEPADLSDYIRGSVYMENYPDSLKDALAIFEKEHINKIIRKNDYNKDEAAKALNIGLSSLYRKMEEYNIPTKFGKSSE